MFQKRNQPVSLRLPSVMPPVMPFGETLARKSCVEDIKGPFEVGDFVDRHLFQIEIQNLPNFDAIRTNIQGLSGNVAADQLTEVLNSISDSVGSMLGSWRSSTFTESLLSLSSGTARKSHLLFHPPAWESHTP